MTQPSTHVPTTIFKPVPRLTSSPAPMRTKSGAGYKAEAIEVLKINNGGDPWFRPADVCVAPDGAVYVADWYDPGVGGHATGDTPAHLHGRVYRIAPPGFHPAEVKLDLATTAGQIAALGSPNFSTRYLGYTKLAAGGDEAVKALNELYKTSKNPRLAPAPSGSWPARKRGASLSRRA